MAGPGTVPCVTDLVYPGLADTLRRLHGPAAEAWLEGLPKNVEQLSWSWGFEVVRPLRSETSVVLRCTQPSVSEPRILKLSPASPAAVKGTSSALWAFSTAGLAPAPIRVSPECGAILSIEVEGVPLSDELVSATHSDEVAAFLPRLHSVFKPADVPELHTQVLSRLESALRFLPHFPTSPVSPMDIYRGITTVTELTSRPHPQVLLHGDLSPASILRTKEALVVLSPKPAIGDPCYDVAVYALRSSGPTTALDTASRISRVSNLDQWRTFAWVKVLAADLALVDTAYNRGTEASRKALVDLSRS